MKKKLLFLINVDWFFLSHRLPIALEALRQGYEVHIATGITNKLDVLHANGLIVHPLSLKRSSTGLVGEVKTFWEILQVFRKVQPHIVHLVTIKPVLFGGIAARLAGVPAVVAAISGLGYIFMAKGWKATVVRSLVAGLYRLALGQRNLKVICQNPDDREALMQAAGLALEKVAMIPGSGVDLSAYTPMQFPQGVPVVIMAARLLRDKGVYEFVSAARLLKQRGVNARFWLVGEPDPDNPASVKKEDLLAWRSEETIEVLGYRLDVIGLFAQAFLVVLPSYREGLPKVLIEAAASGRAVVTTDVPGCRDAVVQDETGILVPPRDAVALADAIQHLLEDTELCKRMGLAGRRLAERKFAIEKVISAHMEIYHSLTGTGS
ncbi:glycosyltransferase family 4 protein [Desulfopila sp. IMCC35006]|uniref:glycosyltransferase family 4 protein n=1 Tax=Desulfopila sp. IMCC35006 TaxID=2569542 RepID=UPI0010AD7798|nr:glycosyltransferase family 4 protein [Desulfopila sp. IMCC35006]TKB26131.1 glycosyltransferase family 4 protein [Desulfopila sp. IMCC35006]